MADILIVDDDRALATAFHQFLGLEGHDCRLASSAQDALQLIDERKPNLVMMDVRMPGVDGLQALEQIRAGQFSRELYDALAVITLFVPPLRARRDDIPLLVRYFTQRFNAELSQSMKSVDELAIRHLRATLRKKVTVDNPAGNDESVGF